MAIAETLTACLPPWARRRAQESVARYSWFSSWALNLLQIHERNLDPSKPEGTKVPGLKKYVEMVRQWAAERTRIMGNAEGRIEDLQKLGKVRREKLFKLLYEEQLVEDSEFVGFTDEDLRRRGFDAEMIATRHKIRKDFEGILDQMQEIAERDVSRRYRAFEEEGERQKALREIRRDFAKLRKKPYFPLMRFGKFSLTIYDADGKVDSFQLFETQRSRDAASRKAAPLIRARKGWRSVAGLLPDQHFSFQGLPPRFREMLIEKLNMTQAQRTELNSILNKIAPEQSFRKQFLERNKTAGFAHAGMRTYANYFFHGANHLARVKYASPLQDAITAVRAQRYTIPGSQVDSTEIDGIGNYLEKHLDYILNPKNELAGLRAWGFFWYLGFMPKSALVNMTQVPLVTFPYLGARYGDAAATRVLPGAIRDAIRGPARDSLPRHEAEMLEELMELGLIDQSFATELAALSGGTKLNVALADSKAAETLRSIVGKSTFLFSLAEKINRRASALAAYRLHREKLLAGRKPEALTEAELSHVHAQATKAARDSVETTQFEYSSWNRPPFMRGKSSVIFMFMQYVQNMLFFLARDQGNMRYVALMLFFAGLQGLPFAEDLFDLIDRMFSTPNQRFNVRQEVREFALELSLNPDYLMMGLSSESFGLSWLGEQVGIPIPAVDLSGSLSMGRPIGITEPLLHTGPQESSRLMSGLGEAAGGAAFAVPANMIRAATSDNPNLWKRGEMFLPNFAKGISRAWRYAAQGEETTLAGTFLVDLDKAGVRDFGTLSMQALGFSPSAVSQARRAYGASKEVEIYYSARRTALMGELNYAYQSGDREAIRAALDEVTRYNRDVPYGELRLRRSSIDQSRKRYQRKRQADQRGQPVDEQYIRIGRDTRKAYEGF